MCQILTKISITIRQQQTSSFSFLSFSRISRSLMTLHEREKIRRLASLTAGNQFKHLPFSHFFYSLFWPSLVPEEVSLEGSDLNEFVSQTQQSGP
jgi:hypothetical protein